MNSVNSGAMTMAGQSFGMRMRGPFAALAIAAACLSACASPSPQPPTLAAPAAPVDREQLPRFAQTGIASWYARTAKLTRTANGEQMGADKLTAAHRTLPMHTMVRVTNLQNGLSVQVRINDRGPYIPGRVIDLSRDAAVQLGMKDDGIVLVRIEVFDTDQRAKANKTLASQ